MKKTIQVFIATLFFYICKILPIKKNQIVFFSLDSELSDNPKYIYKEFKKSKKEYKLYWIMSNDKIQHIDNQNNEFVKKYSIKASYILARSKIVITNYRKLFLFKLKRKQKYIQTWHGTALKKIEQDVENILTKSYLLNAKSDSKDCDLMISGNEYSTRLLKSKFWYKGEVLNSGTPRNDLMFLKDENLKEEIKTKLGITKKEKVIMYAPTFRGANIKDLPPIDVGLMLSKLNETNIYAVILRLHPNVSKGININEHYKSSHGKIINGSLHNDMAELLFITDILITDYSSTMFDFSLSHKPCLLYTYDEEKYVNNDRGVYMSLDELPYSRYKTIEELIEGIKTFNEEQYIKNITTFFNKLGNYEKGNASKQVVSYIEKNFL